MCSAENFFRNNTEYRVYLDTISRYKYVMSTCYISETKDGAQPRNFLKNCSIWHYLENISTNILRCYCMLKC